MAEKIEFNLSVSKDDLNAALSSATNEAKKTEKAIFRLSDAFASASDELSRIKTSFIGNLGANAVTGAFNSLKSVLGETVQQAREYSKAIAEVNSILPRNAKLTKDQIDLFIQLSSLYGKSAQSEAKAFYEIVSGGVEDTATAFKILKQANEAATAGLTDVNVAAKTLTSTFNVFSQQGTTVNEITDALFQAVKDGQTTFEELSGTLGRVSSFANSAGLNINELAGSIAFLTKSGITSDQAITGLRAIISNIVAPSEQAAKFAKDIGIQFGVAGIRANGFAGFLDKVRIATKGNADSIAKLFTDINAINTVTAITGKNFDGFKQTLDSNRNSIGATASAAKELKQSFDFQAGQAEQSIKNLATSLSVFLLPALQTTLTGFKALTGIGQTNIILDENQKKLKELSTEYNRVKEALDQLKNASGASDRQLQESIKVVGSVAQGEQRLNQILKERQAIRDSIAASTKTEGGVVVDTPVDPAAEAQALKLRQETFQKLAIARTEFEAAEQQRKFDAFALAGEANKLELESLLAFEQQKIDARFAKEVELTNQIADEELKRNGLKAIQLQKDLALENKRNTELSKLKKAEADETNRILSIRNNYIQAAANIASGIFKQGSKEAFYIQKAAALASIAIDDAKARTAAVAVSAALPPGPSQAYLAKQYALITSNTALATSAVVASALSGFANGGIVGNNQLSTSGPDNTIIKARNGEAVLTADDQKELLTAIRSGSLSSGGDIVVQIDSREIARAVRSQLNSGFRLT